MDRAALLIGGILPQNNGGRSRIAELTACKRPGSGQELGTIFPFNLDFFFL